MNITVFAVSCPYFDFTADSAGGDHEAVSVEEKVQNAIMLLIIGGALTRPQTYNIILHYCASICYHFECLNSNCHV